MRGASSGVGRLFDRVGWPGGDLLFRGLSRSTIGAAGLYGRVRDGIGCFPRAMATRPTHTIEVRCCMGCTLLGCAHAALNDCCCCEEGDSDVCLLRLCCLALISGTRGSLSGSGSVIAAHGR